MIWKISGIINNFEILEVPSECLSIGSKVGLSSSNLSFAPASWVTLGRLLLPSFNFVIYKTGIMTLPIT